MWKLRERQVRIISLQELWLYILINSYRIVRAFLIEEAKIVKKVMNLLPLRTFESKCKMIHRS